jgi:hypothetical protein
MVADLSGGAALNVSGGTEQTLKYSARVVGAWAEI